MNSEPPSSLVHVDESQACCSSPWEEAYARFETPEEEIRKFMSRLERAGAADWKRDARVVELFCGRGNGLHALSRLGFTSVEGADLSASLLQKYQGLARCYVADCRRLPFPDASRDIVIIQGGLHHLPAIPADLELTLTEIRRVLHPEGFVFILEPWLTPFLRFVHAVCRQRLARLLSVKIDSLATMIEHERETYFQWLNAPEEIRAIFIRTFPKARIEIAWGKMVCVGA